jgi:hypothetical protein
MRRVHVAPTGRTGRGLFANVPFASGQTILVIKGRPRTSSYDGRYRIGPRWIGVGDCLWIEPAPGSYASFINHSCDANAVITGDRALVAVVPIAKGQEIWIDYSTTEADPHWKMACKCGTPQCRGIIRAAHSLPLDMYERYRPYLAPFVLRARAASRGPYREGSTRHNVPPTAIPGRDNAGATPRTLPPHDIGVRRGDPALARWGASGAADGD